MVSAVAIIRETVSSSENVAVSGKCVVLIHLAACEQLIDKHSGNQTAIPSAKKASAESDSGAGLKILRGRKSRGFGVKKKNGYSIKITVLLWWTIQDLNL